MIFKKKDKIPMKFGLMLGMKVCVPKFDVKRNQDTAEIGYIIARRERFVLATQAQEGGRYWKYLVKFADGSSAEYGEEQIYLDYDKRLEDGKNDSH